MHRYLQQTYRVSHEMTASHPWSSMPLNIQFTKGNSSEDKQRSLKAQPLWCSKPVTFYTYWITTYGGEIQRAAFCKAPKYTQSGKPFPNLERKTQWLNPTQLQSCQNCKTLPVSITCSSLSLGSNFPGCQLHHVTTKVTQPKNTLFLRNWN